MGTNNSILWRQRKLTGCAYEHMPVLVCVYALPGAMRTSAPDISVDTGNTDTSALLM
jgi:hypothetical protein